MAAGIELLLDSSMQRNQELSGYALKPLHELSDEDADSESPIIDEFRIADGPGTFVKMTNFSEAEINST